VGPIFGLVLEKSSICANNRSGYTCFQFSGAKMNFLRKRLNRFFLQVFLIVTCLITFTSACRASVDTLEFGAVGLVNFSMARISFSNQTAAGYGGGTAFGGGIFASVPFLPAFRIESGLFYVPELYSTFSTVYMFNELQVPILVRFTPIPFLSVGAGGYVGLGIGNVSITSGTNASTSTTYQQQFLTQFDWGLVASVQLDLPLSPEWSILADARYQFGLQDMNSTVNSGTYTGGLMVLAGVKYSL
jgi:hypothetical protein